MKDADYINQALQYWSPTWPRRVTKYQKWATTPDEAVELLLDAERNPVSAPFISTYSFPNGHTTTGHVPWIDRIFIDFDIPATTDYRAGDGLSPMLQWTKDMSQLLVRVRKVAAFLLTTERPRSWQATLSGHKGVHLDLVFPPLSEHLGTTNQYLVGLNSYAETIQSVFEQETGLKDLGDYIDVTSKDMARLRRVPNTLHLEATRVFKEDRFCVPVTLDELATMTPARYMKLTKQRRALDSSWQPIPNEAAGAMLTQRVKMALPSSQSGGTRAGVNYSKQAIEQYLDRMNPKISVDDIPAVMASKPCIAAFRDRDDAFDHGFASHKFELFVMTNLLAMGVPIEVEYDENDNPHVSGGALVEYFETMENYDPEFTRQQIEMLISQRYRASSCEMVWGDAPQFCLKNQCHIYNSDYPNYLNSRQA